MKNKLTNLSFFFFFISLLIFVLLKTGVPIGTTGSVYVVVMIFAVLSPIIGLIVSFVAPESSINNLSVVLNLIATLYFGFVFLLPMIIWTLILLKM